MFQMTANASMPILPKFDPWNYALVEVTPKLEDESTSFDQYDRDQHFAGSVPSVELIRPGVDICGGGSSASGTI